MRRLLLVGVGLLGLVVVGLGAGVALAPDLVKQRLQESGYAARAVAWCDAGLCLEGVEGPLGKVGAVTVGWDRRVLVRDAIVDGPAAVEKVGGGGSGGGSGAGGGGRSLLGWIETVEVEGLQVQGLPVGLPPLSGTVHPTRHLEGEGVVIDGSTVRAQVETPYGPCEIVAEPEGAGARGSARCEGLHFQRDSFAPETVTLGLVTAEGRFDGTRAQLVVHVGEVELHVDATRQGDGLSGTFRLPQTPLAAAYALVADAVPEVKRARIEGTVSAEGTFAWPSMDVTLTPVIEGFAVSGVLPSGFGNGPFTYTTRTPEGEKARRTTGPGTPGWTSLAEVSPLLPDAIVVSEDSTFWWHPGYDLPGMLAAAKDNRDRGETWRGGSTLTQQLAKNLFLDGTRTYARKLRELLYAVELEKKLGKQRIMELYVNVVEWGPGIYGVAAATDVYFLRPPAGLLPEEAAWLAGILPGPRSAWTRQYLAQKPSYTRVQHILGVMRTLDEAGKAEAAARQLHFVPPPQGLGTVAPDEAPPPEEATRSAGDGAAP